MEAKKNVIESYTPFSQSRIWEFNRQYYQKVGLEAWNTGVVPHHLTSNAMVGKSYASIIYGMLLDLAVKGKNNERVYILELGAGHGRLCFHILRHLENMIERSAFSLPPFTYILSDIAEQNLDYFINHAQFETYFDRGMLDVAYYDAVHSDAIVLRHSGLTILPKFLNQVLIAIGNYFFDSIPHDLFYINKGRVSECLVSITTDNHETTSENIPMEDLDLEYFNNEISIPYYKDESIETLLQYYSHELKKAYLLMPSVGIQCIEKLKALSNEGLMVITMDKGSQHLSELEGRERPDYITHGSFSLNVNYHAFAMHCNNSNGLALFSSSSNYFLELGCLFYLNAGANYKETMAAFESNVNDFGPDDFFGLTKYTYDNIPQMSIRDLILFIRLSCYDSTFFYNILPHFKQRVKAINNHEKDRVSQTLHKIWHMYFVLDENYDLAFEMGGIFFDLGMFTDALTYFDHSTRLFGDNEDTLYNKALCFYQLRQDEALISLLKNVREEHPAYARMQELAKLDLGTD